MKRTLLKLCAHPGHSGVPSARCCTRRPQRNHGAETPTVWPRQVLRFEQPIHALASSPSGTGVAVAPGKTLQLLHLPSTTRIHTFTCHTDDDYCVLWHPSGLLVSGSKDGTVRLWDIPAGKVKRVFPSHTGGVSAIALSPDGLQLLAGGNNGTVEWWDIPTGRLRATHKGHQGWVSGLVFTPDGKGFYSSGLDGKALKWMLGSETPEDHYLTMWTASGASG